jgi:hypothetical protein
MKVLASKVFRAFGLQRLKQKRMIRQRNQLKALRNDFLISRSFSFMKREFSDRKRISFLKKRLNRLLLRRYFLRFEKQKRISVKFKRAFTKITAYNNREMLRKAFSRWTDRHFDYCGLCRKSNQLIRKIELIKQKYIFREWKMTFRYSLRLKSLEKSVRRNSRSFSIEKCFEIWVNRFRVSESLHLNDRIHRFEILKQKQRFAFWIWRDKLENVIRLRRCARILRILVERNIESNVLQKWKNSFVVRQIMHQKWQSAKHFRFVHLTRSCIDKLKQHSRNQRILRRAVTFREFRLKRKVFHQLITNRLLTSRSFYLVSSVIECWSIHICITAFRKWRAVVRQMKDYRSQLRAAQQVFEMKRLQLILIGFVSGSNARNVKVPSYRPLVPTRDDSETLVLQLEAKLLSLPPGSTTEFLDLIKQINFLRQKQSLL